MTTRRITLDTPYLDLATFASTLTARGSHAQALALLASDAAGGHPRQRAVIDRTTGGTFHVMLARGVARWLLIRLQVAHSGTITSNEVHVDLSVTDGTTTISSSDSRIPAGLKGDTNQAPTASSFFERLDILASRLWVLDLAELETGGTALTGDRRTLTFVVTTSGANVYCESLTVEELPRWVIDDAEAYGALPELYLQRGTIVDGAAGVQRLGATVEQGYSGSLRTYHQLARPEADPWSISSTISGAWPGDEETAGTARKYRALARTLRGTEDPAIAFRVRYRTSGAGDGEVQLVTGAGTYTLSLPATSGTWAEAEGTGYLDAATPEQQLSWKGSVASGTLEISSRNVFDDPA